MDPTTNPSLFILTLFIHGTLHLHLAISSMHLAIHPSTTSIAGGAAAGVSRQRRRDAPTTHGDRVWEFYIVTAGGNVGPIRLKRMEQPQ